MFKNKKIAIVLLSFVGLCFGSFEIHPSEAQDKEALFIAMESMVIMEEGRSESKKFDFKKVIDTISEEREIFGKSLNNHTTIKYDPPVENPNKFMDQDKEAMDALYMVLEAMDEVKEAMNEVKGIYFKAMGSYNKSREALRRAFHAYNKAGDDYNKKKEAYNKAMKALYIAKEAQKKKLDAYSKGKQAYDKAGVAMDEVKDDYFKSMKKKL